MDTFFGIVKDYFPDRGFGFLKHPIHLGPNQDVFFHIKGVLKSDLDIATRLSKYETNSHICFWYRIKTTYKGLQLSCIIKPEDVFKLNQQNQSKHINTIKSIYESRLNKPLPFWIEKASIGLLGFKGKEKLYSIRMNLIEERKKEEERQKKIEEEALSRELTELAKEREVAEEDWWERQAAIEEWWKRQAAIEEWWKRQAENEEWWQQQEEEEAWRRKKASKFLRKATKKAIRRPLLAGEKQRRQRMIEEEEFAQLVAEMKQLGFINSHEVSSYIVDNKLGYKYKNISGKLKMTDGHSTWDFDGGFPPHIYAKLCEELGLGNKGTDSKPIGFIPFKDFLE